ncbi:Fibroblast growth factor receptor-like 1 [Chionoecetes opilio]|uniref:Fibroblast growth factor receptor-like 1 n=1 Tax=Chionoecetes opilio TaxID=41210 RepID=A0A8J5CKK6_CHIOP|nr:Fibroblast growth factor receptor-like 1 [Chionoecetes opilio]
MYCCFQGEEVIPDEGWDRMRLQGKTLRIKEVTPGDQGVYVCSAVNGFGKEIFTITLTVNGTSSAETSLSLSWRAREASIALVISHTGKSSGSSRSSLLMSTSLGATMLDFQTGQAGSSSRRPKSFPSTKSHQSQELINQPY